MQQKLVLALTIAVAAIVAAFAARGVISINVYRTDFWAFWDTPLFTLGQLPITASFLLKSAVFLVCLTLVSRLGTRFLRLRLLSRTGIDPGLQYAIQVGASYFIFLVGLVVGLQSVGLNLSSLAFITGIIGVGVGFGTQNIMNNFVSGLILLIERPIKVGDRVEVETLNGDVVRIGARSTWVRTNDNIIIIVPNADFISSRVTNWTANDRKIRVRVPVGVGYSSKPEVVRTLLLDVANRHCQILQTPAPDVIFVGFGDNSLNFELRVWTMDFLRTPQILQSDIYFDVFRVFSEQGIEIPFPQRDVHLKGFENLLSAKT